MTLASKLRPKKINDVIGQDHLVGKNGLVYNMVKNQKPFSLIFYGPPGCGKTTIATCLANELNLRSYSFNPVANKKEELVKIISYANNQEQVIIIMDEIHRLNRDKQDILLPCLEDGRIILFASTTENPFFTINPAIRSRCHICQVYQLQEDDILSYAKRISNDLKLNFKSIDELKMLIHSCGGDLRSLINSMDIIDQFYADQVIDEEVLKKVIPNINTGYSSYGDSYYNLLSALHKSIRGSDFDAAIYYLAQLINGGDLKSIYRRLIACAYEDIGLANPSLCARVVTATQGCEIIGLPEAKQILASIVIEMCLSPKSNSAYLAIDNALEDLNKGLIYPIPKHLQDNHYQSASKLGVKGYKYPHDYPNHYVQQQYLPLELMDKRYYNKTNNAIENKLNEIHEAKKRKLTK